MKTVTLISKDNCHLCEVAKEVILSARNKTSFNLIEKKITPSTADFDLYHERIPVILIEGKFAFQYKVSERQFLEKLKS